MATLKDFLRHWKLDELKISTGFLDANISFKNADRDAAWEMYIELLTRVSTQYLSPKDGDEQAALDSIYSLFKTTRDIIKKNGADCINFAKIAIVILNQVIRPFTSKWHKKSLSKELEQAKEKIVFRKELEDLQGSLRSYTGMLAEIADVEDLTNMES